MVTEIEKRIEDAASEYIKTCKENMHSVSEAYCKADFQAGAKFILEMPEFKEIREALEFYADRCKGHEGMAPQYNELNDLNCINENFGETARQALSRIKALGIVKEGEK